MVAAASLFRGAHAAAVTGASAIVTVALVAAQLAAGDPIAPPLPAVLDYWTFDDVISRETRVVVADLF